MRGRNSIRDHTSELTMIVYIILNRLNGKGYVGQSIHSFRHRYRGYKWWQRVTSPVLKAAIAKYGSDAFDVLILESGLASRELLNLREAHYIGVYNTFRPGGYNCSKDGRHDMSTKNTYAEWGDKIALSRCPIVRSLLDNRTGTVYEAPNISRFCREHSISGPSLTHVLLGEQWYYKSWSLPQYPMRRIELISPANEVFNLLDGEVSGFCRRHGIARGNLTSVLKGNLPHANGWTGRFLNPEAKGPSTIRTKIVREQASCLAA